MNKVIKHIATPLFILAICSIFVAIRFFRIPNEEGISQVIGVVILTFIALPALATNAFMIRFVPNPKRRIGIQSAIVAIVLILIFLIVH